MSVFTITMTVENQSNHPSHITIFQKPTETTDFPKNPWREITVNPRSSGFSFEVPGVNFEYAVSARFEATQVGTSMLRIKPNCTCVVSGSMESGCKIEMLGA